MSLYTQASCQYPNKRHVIIQTSDVIIQTSVPNKRHVIIQTSVPNKRRSYPNKRRVIIRTSDDIIQTSVMTLSKQASRHYPNKTSVTSLFKQALEPLYWHTPPDWYSRYENVHPYKLFTECTPVNRCCTTTSVNPYCTAADSFTRLLPTQCSVENIWHRFAAHSLPPCNRQGQKPFGVVWFVLLLYKCTPLGEV